MAGDNVLDTNSGLLPLFKLKPKSENSIIRPDNFRKIYWQRGHAPQRPDIQEARENHANRKVMVADARPVVFNSLLTSQVFV